MNITEKDLYSLWCEKATEDPDLTNELNSIANDDDAIKDRFYRDLEFWNRWSKRCYWRRNLSS